MSWTNEEIIKEAKSVIKGSYNTLHLLCAADCADIDGETVEEYQKYSTPKSQIRALGACVAGMIFVFERVVERFEELMAKE